MSLEAAVSENKDEPFFTNWKVHLKEGTMETMKASLDAMVAAIVNPEDPKLGVICNAYSRSEQHRDDSLRKNIIYFTELFTDFDAHYNHLSETEGEAVVEVFKCINSRVVGFLNAAYWHEGIKAGLTSNQALAQKSTVGHVFNPYPETLLGGKKWGRRLLSPANDAVMLELRIHPSSKEASDRLLTVLKPLTKITKTDMTKVSSYIVQGPGWWRRDPSSSSSKINLKTRDAKIPQEAYTEQFGSSETIEFRAIYTNCNIRHTYPRALVRELVEIIQSSVASEFIITSPNLENETLQEVMEYFEDNGLLTSDRRTLLSGYLVHPYYTKDWTGKTEEPPAATSSSTPVKTKDKPKVASVNQSALNFADKFKPRALPKAPSANVDEQPVFRIRRHAIKDQPEAVVLEARARACPSTSSCFVVPLIDYLRTVARLGHTDKEVPIGTLYGVLERMRSMQNDAVYINSLSKMNEVEREDKGNLTRVQAIFHKLSLMGRAGYQKEFGQKTLRIDGLEELIESLEKEYSSIVDKAKNAVQTGAAIEYLGLQEVYKIGSVVTTRSVPGLGGLAVSFKVKDCFYEPIRSLMGSLRYSFKMTLETIVNTGQHFVSVPFTESIGDWKNVKEMANLPFQPIPKGYPLSWIDERIAKMNSMFQSEKSFSYMEYPAGSFFPSLGGGRGNKSMGASSSSVMRAAAGQVIVDVKTGLNLGYAPSSRTGELGMMMGSVMKMYLDFIRKATHSNANIDEFNSDGYTMAYESFPSGVNAQPWPCVIGFSMTTKAWGYAVVDRLVPVLPDPRPWSELVLPDSSREMLMSLAKQKMQGSGYQTRYRYDDVIAGKGSGGLYLLYGPPGTGKTLTVEALARYFGKPLYSISFAELGSTTAELEEKLTVTLGLAAHWGSLVLLDEGDALLEIRKQNQLQLNSMTGVLLRLLESFEGSLFINSNRISSFDPAALSRVTFAVKFSPLTSQGMAQIWRNSIARVLQSDTTRSLTREEAFAEVGAKFDLTKFSDFPGSGRSVGAVMKMAIALCSHRNCDLTQDVLLECVDNFLSLHNDLKGEGVAEVWDDQK